MFIFSASQLVDDQEINSKTSLDQIDYQVE